MKSPIPIPNRERVYQSPKKEMQSLSIDFDKERQVAFNIYEGYQRASPKPPDSNLK